MFILPTNWHRLLNSYTIIGTFFFSDDGENFFAGSLFQAKCDLWKNYTYLNLIDSKIRNISSIGMQF